MSSYRWPTRLVLGLLSSWAVSGCGSSSGTNGGGGGAAGTGDDSPMAGSGGGKAGTTGAAGAGTAGTSGSGGTSGGTAGTGGAGSSGSAAGTGGSSGRADAAVDSAAQGGAGSGGSLTPDAAPGGGTVDASAKDSGGVVGLAKFSFFVTSLKAMRQLSKSQDGFGGDLTYGTADGLTGADKICTEIAESSMPGSGAKQWHAFLSVTKGPGGTAVNAIDRIGAGPWYDRRGRVVANAKADLLQNRPSSADPQIKEDLPNETGLGNHTPDPGMPAPDNHHTLTGTDAQGKLYGPKATCLDWTSKLKDNAMTGRPRIGFSWSIQTRINWISGQDEGGCGAGVAIGENGGSDPNNPIVGSGGGYGAIYCFALTP